MTEEKSSCCGGPSRGDNRGVPVADGDVKAAVKERYGRAARAVSAGGSGCCSGAGEKDAVSRDLYDASDAADVPGAALAASLGCANPVALAELVPGETVLDLGSGGGIDVLLSAKRVGPTGMAYGLDMTDEMLALARRNQAEAGVANVGFLKGEIEHIPLPDSSVDVIISNCVINLSADKAQVLREAFRVLRPGGRFAVADIVLVKQVSDAVKRHMALWVGCVAGALGIDEYKTRLSDAGFAQPSVEVVRTYSMEDVGGMVPGDIAEELGEEATADLVGSFVSAFVRAVKPA